MVNITKHIIMEKVGLAVLIILAAVILWVFYQLFYSPIRSKKRKGSDRPYFKEMPDRYPDVQNGIRWGRRR